MVDAYAPGISDQSPGANYQYAYDADGRVTSVRIAPADLASQFPPTVVIGVVTVAVPKSLEELDYTYNTDGTVQKVSDQSDLSSLSAKRGTTSFGYDATDELTQIAQQNTSGYSSGITTKSVGFTYNADGSADTITRNQGASNALVATTSYRVSPNAAPGTGYDAAGRLTNILQTGSGQARGTATLDTNNFTLDNANELQQVVAGLPTAPPTENYTYDANGNRTTSGSAGVSTGVSTGAGNRLTFDGTNTYTFDAAGNRTAKFVDSNHYGVLGAGRQRRQ